MKSLFVHRPDDLEAAIPGGLQLCTREFMDCVREASYEFRSFHIELSLPLLARVRRRFCLGSYLSFEPHKFADALRRTLAEREITHVFLNTADTLRFGPLIKRLKPDATVVLMSHGNQSGDNLYEISGANGSHRALWKLLQTWQLGMDLRTESSIRRSSIDVVCTMSEEESVLERWLGAKATFMIPRIVEVDPVDWSPVAGRVGYAGTLNHTPNRVALEEVFRRIASRPHEGLEVRLVGRPEEIGRSFAARYPFVTYLGGLPGPALREEARSWNLYLNPIFWLSRGASMKLAQALSWGIPTLTTLSGRRGYRVPDRVLISTPDDVGPFVDILFATASSLDRSKSVRTELLGAIDELPSSRSIGRELRSFFDSIGQSSIPGRNGAVLDSV